MDDLIKWVDLKTRSHKLDLSDYDFSIYRSTKTKGRNTSSYLSFSVFFTEVYKNYKKIQVGFIGETIVIRFNNENGINVFFNKSNTFTRMRVSSKPLADLIFEKLGKDENKCTNFYTLKDLGINTFSINKKI